MALSNVEQAVLRKSEEETRQIGEEARRAADALWEKESARLREEHRRRVEATRQELEDTLERKAGMKETVNRHKLLKLKNEIIEEIFQKAVDGILSLPDGGYTAWVKAQVAALPEMEEAALFANERDKALLSEAVSAAGRANVEVAQDPAEIQGGFLVQGRQIDLDYSIEALMETLRESLTEEVAAKLFGEGEA